jgi:hypothetical protein
MTTTHQAAGGVAQEEEEVERGEEGGEEVNHRALEGVIRAREAAEEGMVGVVDSVAEEMEEVREEGGSSVDLEIALWTTCFLGAKLWAILAMQTYFSAALWNTRTPCWFYLS